ELALIHELLEPGGEQAEVRAEYIVVEILTHRRTGRLVGDHSDVRNRDRRHALVQISGAEQNQALAQIVARRKIAQHVVGIVGDLAIKNGAEQLLLRREIAVERRLRATESLR